MVSGDDGSVVEVVDVDVSGGVVVVVVLGVVVVVVDSGVVSGDVGGSLGGGPAGSPPGGTPGSSPGPLSTYTASPRLTRLGKYSAMCIGMRTQPCDAGYVGTDVEPCTATPDPVKYTGL
jgi:hypothetical protein